MNFQRSTCNQAILWMYMQAVGWVKWGGVGGGGGEGWVKFLHMSVLPYSGRFSRGNVFVVRIKPQCFTHKLLILWFN